jgi:HEAT repeat protein
MVLLMVGLLAARYLPARTPTPPAPVVAAVEEDEELTPHRQELPPKDDSPAADPIKDVSEFALKPSLDLFPHAGTTESEPPPAADKPAPVDPKAVIPDPPAVLDRSFKRINELTEEEMRRQLAEAPEVGLGSVKQAAMVSYLSAMAINVKTHGDFDQTDPTPLLQLRPDLFQLPFFGGTQCQLNGRAAATLGALSPKLHAYIDAAAPVGLDGMREPTPQLRTALYKEMRGKHPEWLRAEAVPTLMQILMFEDAPMRRLLVNLLAEIPDKPATVALAQRAVFDLDEEARETAVAALKGRDPEHYRPVLLKALRHPFAPAADHAAEALVALEAKEAVPQLVGLLKQPDPNGPQSVHPGSTYTQEIVRVHHLTNCLLCHPPATTGTELVIGNDPVLTVPHAELKRTSGVVPGTSGGGGGAYGGGSGGGTSSTVVNGVTIETKQIPLQIRADITFVRQDFSLQLPVAGAVLHTGPLGAARQRFDYMIRTRRLSTTEAKLLKDRLDDGTSYPQRDAVLFALRELTGKDAGTTTEAWLQLFPQAELDAEAARLSSKLLNATPARRQEVLNQLRDSKGLVYTQALACAIPSLKGEMKEKAREALEARLTRMTAKTLRDKFQDDDPEIRQAAIVACARKEKAELVPDLVALLDNPEPLTSRLAGEALKTLTGEDLEAPSDWKGWWKKQAETKKSE